MITKQDLAALQQTVLESALTGRTLPGADRAIRLPDLEWVLRGPEILLSDEDLAGSPTLDFPQHPLRIVAPDAVPPDTAYLKLSHSTTADDAVRVRIEVELKPPAGQQKAVGLSAMSVTFQKQNGEWLARDEPLLSAN